MTDSSGPESYGDPPQFEALPSPAPKLTTETAQQVVNGLLKAANKAWKEFYANTEPDGVLRFIVTETDDQTPFPPGTIIEITSNPPTKYAEAIPESKPTILGITRALWHRHRKSPELKRSAQQLTAYSPDGDQRIALHVTTDRNVFTGKASTSIHGVEEHNAGGDEWQQAAVLHADKLSLVATYIGTTLAALPRTTRLLTQDEIIEHVQQSPCAIIEGAEATSFAEQVIIRLQKHVTLASLAALYEEDSWSWDYESPDDWVFRQVHVAVSFRNDESADLFDVRFTFVVASDSAHAESFPGGLLVGLGATYNPATTQLDNAFIKYVNGDVNEGEEATEYIALGTNARKAIRVEVLRWFHIFPSNGPDATMN